MASVNRLASGSSQFLDIRVHALSQVSALLSHLLTHTSPLPPARPRGAGHPRAPETAQVFVL